MHDKAGGMTISARAAQCVDDNAGSRKHARRNPSPSPSPKPIRGRHPNSKSFSDQKTGAPSTTLTIKSPSRTLVNTMTPLLKNG